MQELEKMCAELGADIPFFIKGGLQIIEGIGSNLRAMLFELMTPQMNHVISKQIENLINNYEPRCNLVQVHTQPMFDRNGYSVQISFYVQNHPDEVIVESFLERLR